MKKFTNSLLPVLAFLFFAGPHTSYSGSSISIVGDPSHIVHFTPDVGTVEADIDVKNVSNVPKGIKVKMIREVMAPSHTTSFCWGENCYPPNVMEASYTIQPGGTTKLSASLTTDYMPGTSKVTYEFSDVADPSDKTTFSLTYTSESTTDFQESSAYSLPILSIASPSPAGEIARIDYNAGAQANSHLVLTVYNLIGNPVQSVALTAPAGSIIIQTSDMNSGMYFYSIIADGRKLATKKLIVKH